MGIWHPGLEIFPKQTALDRDIDPPEVGNGLNIPYFGALGGGTSPRYAFDAAGEVIKLDAYLDLAESRRVGLDSARAVALPTAPLEPPLVPVETTGQNSGAKDSSALSPGARTARSQYGRDNYLHSQACSLQARGFSDEAIIAAIKTENQNAGLDQHPNFAVDGPLDDRDIERIVRQALKKQKGDSRRNTGNAHKPPADPLINFVVSARELDALEVPEHKYIVEPFIREASLAMLWAWRGVGKTWVAMELSRAVATGQPLFGEYRVPEAKRVLYVDGELTTSRLQTRFRQLYGQPAPELLDVLGSEQLYVAGCPLAINMPEDQWRIDELLGALVERDRRPALIIFDNLSSLTRGMGENDNDAQEQILAWLLALRHRGYAILQVHHANKTGDQRGASRREDLLDAVIKLAEYEPEKDELRQLGAKFHMTFPKHRDERPDPDHLILELGPGENTELAWFCQRGGKPPAYLRALRAIYCDKPKTQQELGDLLGISRQGAGGLLKKAREKRLVELTTVELTREGLQLVRRHYPDAQPPGTGEIPF
jgi:RecA-family ATPase